MRIRPRLPKAPLHLLVALIWLLPLGALAQDTPNPPCSWNRVTNRAEYKEDLRRAFHFTPPAHQGGRVVIADTAVADTLNPLRGTGFQNRWLAGWIYEPLVGRSPIDGQPIPKLADSWDVSSDGLTFTFHLNRDAHWHDGTDFTAEDVTFTYQTAIDNSTPNRPVENMLATDQGFVAVDVDTFQVTASEQFATVLNGLATLPIMPKHVWETVAYEDWDGDGGSTGAEPSRVVGTGPFKLKEFVPTDTFTLIKNNEYYDGPPTIDEFRVIKVPAEGFESAQALTEGTVDLVELVGVSNEEETRKLEDAVASGAVKVSEVFDTYRMQTYLVNVDPERSSPLADKEVRQALFHAVDRGAILYNIRGASGDEAIGTQPLLSCAYAPDEHLEKYEYDLEVAQEILTDAGWRDTNRDGTLDKDGREFQFSLLYNEEAPDAVKIANQLIDDWHELGVSVLPDKRSWTELIKARDASDYDMVIQFYRWEPSGNQSMFTSEGSSNSMGYRNPNYDALYAKQLQELDSDARREQLIELSKIVWDDLPIGPLYFFRSQVAYDPRIQNFYPNDYAGTFWSLPYIWIDE